MLKSHVPGLLMLVVPGTGIPIRRRVASRTKRNRFAYIDRSRRQVVRRRGSHNVGVLIFISTGHIGVVETIVFKAKVEGWIIARGLQYQRQRHPYVISAVRAADHSVAVDLI